MSMPNLTARAGDAVEQKAAIERLRRVLDSPPDIKRDDLAVLLAMCEGRMLDEQLCGWCGHTILGGSVRDEAAMRAHVETCPESPAVKMALERDELIKERDALRAKRDPAKELLANECACSRANDLWREVKPATENERRAKEAAAHALEKARAETDAARALANRVRS